MADCQLKVKVVPKSSQRRVEALEDGSLKIWVTQAPTDGQANSALIKLLADVLDLAPSKVQIIKGETSRSKTIRVDGIGLEEALRRVRNEPR